MRRIGIPSIRRQTVRVPRNRRARIAVVCTGNATCTGRLTLRAGGRSFGQLKIAVPASRTTRVTLRLSAANAARVRRARRRRLSVTCTLTYTLDGKQQTKRVRLTLAG